MGNKTCCCNSSINTEQSNHTQTVDALSTSIANKQITISSQKASNTDILDNANQQKEVEILENTKKEINWDDIYYPNYLYKKDECESIESDEIPHFEQPNPLSIDNKDIELLKQIIADRCDPFDEIYLALTDSISLYKDLNIPQDIIKAIVLFLDYFESTMDVPDGSSYVSNPTVDYGTEALLLISLPMSTYLPSKSYIFDRIKWRIGWSGKYLWGQIFIGIQEFDMDNITIPGEGNIIFKKTLKVTSYDHHILINPMVELQCGQSYIFWITACKDSTFASDLGSYRREKEKGIKKDKSLNLTNSKLCYYVNTYKVYGHINYYDIWFRHSI